MNRPRLIRGLKITWTVICGIACVLLLVLWVRSYWCWDEFTLNDGVTSLGSNSGTLYWFRSGVPIYPIRSRDLWEFSSGDAYTEMNKPDSMFKSKPGFQILKGDIFSLPYWLPLVLFATLATLATLPWIRLCFSLRTLLIATTLVAVVLGLIVYLAR